MGQRGNKKPLDLHPATRGRNLTEIVAGEAVPTQGLHQSLLIGQNTHTGLCSGQ